MTGSAGLETRELRFAYEDGDPVLKGISLTIARGEFVALIGQNGSGKTTLVKHFNGLLRPTRGTVFLDGHDIRDKTVGTLARQVGHVFQNPDHQIFSATTRAEIEFGPRNLGLKERQVGRIADETLEAFNLTQFADHQPAMLGFGLRRKVSIAAVYSMQTPILILDEPTTGLDYRSTLDLMQLIASLHQSGRTIILITHDMKVVAEFAPHCMVLRDGQVLAYDTTRALFRKAALLRSTHIEAPQISELGRRMVPHGMRDDILTVPEFCETYAEMEE